MTSISGFPSKVKFDYRHYFPSRDGVMIESEALPDPAVDLDAWLYRTGRYVYAMASARDERTGFNGPTCGEIRDTVKARIVAEQRFDTRLVRWYARAEIRRVRKAIADKHPDVSAEAAELWRQVANGFAAYTREAPNAIMNLTAMIVREYDAVGDKIGFIADMYSNTEAWAYPSAARGNNPHRWQSLGTDECAAFLVWAVGECARHGVGVGKNGATNYRFYKTTINQALHKTTFLLYNGTEDSARQLIINHLEKVYPMKTAGTQQELPKPSSAFTAVEINGHIIHATAYAGQSGDDVAESIFALLDGLGKVLKSERVKSYSAIQDGRDRRVSFKANGKQIAPTEQQTEPPPANERTNGHASNERADGNKGTAACVLIKIGKSYNGNKAQIQCECDGFEHTLNYTRDNLVEVLRGATNPRTHQPFVAADLKDGMKFVSNFRVDWAKSEKDGKTFTNVVAIHDAE